MRTFLKHVVLPSVAPAAIIALYFTPVSLVGCANRGLMALGVVFAALIAGIAVGIAGLRARRDGGPTVWFSVSIVILVIPALLVLGPLG